MRPSLNADEKKVEKQAVYIFGPRTARTAILSAAIDHVVTIQTSTGVRLSSVCDV
jgi:hypothetical protein